MELLAHLSRLVAPPFCWGCGADARPGPLCPACRSGLRWLGDEPVELNGVSVWAPVAYEGPARALVSGLKYRGAAGLAAPLAAQIAACAAPGAIGPGVGLVPVPLHPVRLRRRGFNQAERLARELARRTGARSSDCLRRGGPAMRQVGRGRAERLSSAPLVETIPGAGIPASALIIDDVVTTGATVAAVAAALREAGADVLGAVAYARTPGR